MFLITEQKGAHKAEASFIEEGESKNLYLEGIFSTADNVNKNGRSYPEAILKKEFDRYNEQCVMNNTAAGELNHPASSSINPDRISHRITEMHQEGKDFIGKAIVLENDMGDKIRSFIKADLKVGVSTRALGTVTKTEGVNVINDDLNLICVDVVMNPSNQTSFVNGILEGMDFIMENGVIVPHKIEEAKEPKSDGDDKEYEAFFKKTLKTFGVDEPDQLKGDDKKKFFDAIDKGWKSDKEKVGIAEEIEKIKQEVLSAKAFELAETKMKAFKDFMEVITR